MLAEVPPEPSAVVQGDPAQIEHLVAHLHRYSLNAMPKGGAVEAGARCVEGDAVKLWVKDSGGGIYPGAP